MCTNNTTKESFMKVKHFRIKSTIITSTAILLFAAIAPNAFAFTEQQSNASQDNISVNVKQIKEIANQSSTDVATPSQSLAYTIAELVSSDTVGPDGNLTTKYTAQDVLKYLYPSDNAQQLAGVTITTNQALTWLHSVGYNANVINRPLTTAEIKSKLDQNQPIITVLTNQNTADWLNASYAGILYAHDDATAGTSALHKSFIKSANYGEAELQDGQETQPFSFNNTSSSPDPMIQKDSFKWTSTITDIKPDTSWFNSNTISTNKATGIFASKLTKSGNQSELDFTDSAVTKLLNQYPATNPEQETKLAAVALINLYEDSAHQKTVNDLNTFLKVSDSMFITTAQIESWYQALGFDFDVINGKAPMVMTQAINSSGRLYLTTFDSKTTENPEKNTAMIGVGYLNNAANGYHPMWTNVKAGDNISTFYNTPTTKAGQTQYQKLASTFSYSDIQKTIVTTVNKKSTVTKYSYAENATIYNIRLKGTPDSTETNVKPTTSVATAAPATVSSPTTNGNYVHNNNFTIRETQGSQPWCSAYVNAAAVNVVNKTSSATSPITAQNIMKYEYPKLSESDLENTVEGPTVQAALQGLQKQYGVTADYVNRTLSFSEVKKQIDNGEIVQIGAYTPTISKTDTSDAHALAIVGYITPKSGNAAPYYEVWNPWWNQTFYVSSASPYRNLAGAQFTWKDSWINWRKSSTVGSVSTTQTAHMVNPYTEQKPVKTLPAPIVDLSSQVISRSIFAPFTDNLKTSMTTVSSKMPEMGAETVFQTISNTGQYGFSLSLDEYQTQMRARRNNEVKIGPSMKLVNGINVAEDFRTKIKALNTNVQVIAGIVTCGAMFEALIAIAPSLLAWGLGMEVLTGIFGGGTPIATISGALYNLKDYHHNLSDVDNDFNQL